VNTLLVEYEDVFPFDGMDIAADRKTLWSKRMLKEFLDAADANGIDVIPLQQCVGHFEYLLGWKKYRKLAEDQAYPSTIRVDDPKARAVVFDMLRQVIEAHPRSKYVHLGMDEAHGLFKGAKRMKRDFLELYLDYLGDLLEIVEPYGKTPIIWSDMLEDHFRPDAFGKYKERVIIMTWEYGKVMDRSSMGRLAGRRVSKAWLDEPENLEAPAIGPGTQFAEDWPADIKRAIKPYMSGRTFTPLFHMDLWAKLGFRVLGTSAARASSFGIVYPNYNNAFTNVRGWSNAVKRTGQMGQVASSWARGTSWCPPNFNIDLQWPIVAEMSRSMGAKPEPFWPGIPESTVSRIIRTLGRCREDWRLEAKLADEMEQLAPKIKKHRYEWEGLMLMARVLDMHRRADYVCEEVDYFHANYRPAEVEWQRRIDEQNTMLKELAAMRKKVTAHFSKRWHGDALNEWLDHLFDLPAKKIRDRQGDSKRKLALSRKSYASRR
jgi:hypothetical protein